MKEMSLRYPSLSKEEEEFYRNFWFQEGRKFAEKLVLHLVDKKISRSSTNRKGTKNRKRKQSQ